MSTKIPLLSLITLLSITSYIHAQATAPAQNLQATVRQVVGMAQMRPAENAAWQTVRVGMVVGEGAEFRTGPRSRVVFQIPPDQTIILDRLGIVRLLIAKRTIEGVQTNLGMPYGRTEYQVEEAGLQHDAKITSPGATLAVRGTKDMLLYDHGPFEPLAIASQPVRLRSANGKTVNFGRAGARARVATDKNSPGEQAVVEARIDPAGAFAGRTQAENELLAYLAKVAPNLDIGSLGVFASLNDPNFKGPIIGIVPNQGQIRFQLFWTTSFFSDIDIIVRSPLGEVVSATNPKVKSSGRHLGEEASVKGSGQEAIVWEKSYPLGSYIITVREKKGTSSKGASQVFVDVDRDPLDEKRAEQLGFFTTLIDAKNQSENFKINVGPRGTGTPSTQAKRRRK
jgi:hypothetical protein